MSQDDGWLTIQEAANELGVCYMTAFKAKQTYQVEERRDPTYKGKGLRLQVWMPELRAAVQRRGENARNAYRSAVRLAALDRAERIGEPTEPPDDGGEPWHSVESVADYLGVLPDRVHDYVRRGLVPSWRDLSTPYATRMVRLYDVAHAIVECSPHRRYDRMRSKQ